MAPLWSSCGVSSDVYCSCIPSETPDWQGMYQALQFRFVNALSVDMHVVGL